MKAKPARNARTQKAPRKRKRRILRRLLGWGMLIVAAWYALCCLGLLYCRVFPPLITSVQIQRQIEAVIAHQPYKRIYSYAPLSRISRDLQRAVIAAEDGRFYHHHGIDWVELGKIAEKDLAHGRLGRGGSTITQQLVKNLFGTTHRTLVRKGMEFAVTPATEIILPKDRILELYLNVIEWGPGVYGAEAAAQYHYGTTAARIGREQAARLAACIPEPRRRKPSYMDDYSAEILGRMRQLGW